MRCVSNGNEEKAHRERNSKFCTVRYHVVQIVRLLCYSAITVRYPGVRRESAVRWKHGCNCEEGNKGLV